MLLMTATGGTITTDGDYKVHTFTSSGTFEVTFGSGDAWYLVVGGGGGGGGTAGGGAGGFRSNGTYDYPVTVGSYTVTVGAGGNGSASASTKGSTGSNSVFDTITSNGGGGGGAFSDANAAGANGASGGGGGSDSTSPFTGRAGGTGTVGQGNDGGAGITGSTAAGGGGGAGAVGSAAALNTGGAGGVGTASAISGASVTYAGGGGGCGLSTRGDGGSGGGGQGGTSAAPTSSTAGTANTGGGGGGSYGAAGKAGGSGVVIIRYRFQILLGDRDISNGLDTALAASSLSPIGLVEMNFESGTVRFWTGRGDLVVDGETYTGTGTLGKISSIEETTELRPVSVDLELSGIPSAVLEIANSEEWWGRDVIIHYGALQQTGNRMTLVDDPFQIFKGKMDMMTLVDGKESAIKVTAESKQVDLERNSPRRYTAEDQRSRFENDKGCDAVASLQQKEIRWGG